MAKERKPDLGSPEEEALEQHVHDMMDITVPDEPEVKATPSAKKGISIAITHADEGTVALEKDAELEAVTQELNEQLAESIGTAPLLPESPKKAAKKVTVVHHEDESSELEAPAAPEAVEDEVEETSTEPTPSETPAVDPPVIDLDPETPIGELADKTSPLEPEIDSVETDKAVSEIIAEESDALLSAQDNMSVAEQVPEPAARKKGNPSLLSLILRSPSFRWTVFLVLIGGLIFAGLYPKTRYYILNKAGVRSTASITITDQSTLRPLKNVKVTLAGQTAMSNEEGKASLSGLPLGSSELTIEKRAYATQKRPVTVGWGSNPMTDVGLKPQGIQYGFQVNDVFSGKPITDVEASVGELSATANEKGEIKLALDTIEGNEVTVVFKAAGYRDLEYKLQLSNKETVEVAMTPSKKIAFVTKRSGSFDVYKVDVDGKNEALVLKGTGKESTNLSLLQHPTSEAALLLSTRDGGYGADGTLKQTLTYINLKDNTTKSVVSSSQLKPIDWVGTRLVYVMLDDAANQDSTNRYKLMSYDFVSGDNRQLAAANYFNSVVPMGGKIYYAPASAYQNGINNGVFAVHADGSGKDAILDKEAWNMFRTGHDVLTIAVQQEWYQFKSDSKQPEKLSGQPTDTTSRVYVDSPDGKHSIWVDNRDGKGALVSYDSAKKSEDVLLSEAGIKGPVRWINDTTVVYRVASTKETADYVMSIEGGTGHKIVDATNAAGIEPWSY